jgi:hypothetical protein
MISSIKHSRSRIVLLGALAGLSVAIPASATDIERHPGSSCQPENSTAAGKLTYSTAGVKNTGGSGSATVICPMASHFYNPHGSEAQLYYYDNSGSNLSCTHYWTDMLGGMYWSWGFTSSGASTSWNRFKVTDPDPLSFWKTWQCTLPATSSISIFGYEYTDEEDYI